MMTPEQQVKYYQDLENLFNSPEYTILEKQLSVNNASFEHLDPKIKLIAVYLHKIGQDGIVPDLWRYFYRRPLLTIDQFLTPEIVGLTSQALFPKWREVLLRDLSPNSQVNEFILGGAAGQGKTFAASLAHAFNLYRVSNLLHPQLTLGVAPSQLITLSLFTVTLSKAALAVLRPFKQMLLETNIFQEVKRPADFHDFVNKVEIPFYESKTESYLVFPHNIVVNIGSQLTHAISFSMFGAMLDEGEYRSSGSIEQAFAIYSNLKQRVMNRFLDSRFIMLTLMSSARHSTGLISSYTKTIPKDDPHIRYYKFALWEVRSFDAYKAGSFYAMHGTPLHPSRVLNADETKAYDAGLFIAPERCEVHKVPLAHLQNFTMNTDDAFRDLAGIQSEASDRPFIDTEQIENDELPAEFNLIAKFGDVTPLFDQLPAIIFQKTPSGLKLARYPDVPRYLHLDLAVKTEAGFSLWHKELDGDVVRYVADFLCWITSPSRIDLNAIKRLVIDLAMRARVYFAVVSADQFQSDPVRQELEQANIARSVQLLSVDRTIHPYSSMAHLNSRGQIKAGKCPKLRAQLHNLMIDDARSSGKIMMEVTAIRKDLADSSCGGIYSASMNVADIPQVKYFDNKTVLIKNNVQQLFDGMTSV